MLRHVGKWPINVILMSEHHFGMSFGIDSSQLRGATSRVDCSLISSCAQPMVQRPKPQRLTCPCKLMDVLFWWCSIFSVLNTSHLFFHLGFSSYLLFITKKRGSLRLKTQRDKKVSVFIPTVESPV